MESICCQQLREIQISTYCNSQFKIEDSNSPLDMPSAPSIAGTDNKANSPIGPAGAENRIPMLVTLHRVTKK